MFGLESKLVRASYLTSDLGKTKAFAMLMKVSVEQIRERSLPAKKGQVPGKVKLSWRLEVKLYHCSVKKKKNDCSQQAQHNEFGVSFVGQLAWDTEPVRFFFSLGILFLFRAPA